MTENVPAGWDLTSATCTGGTDNDAVNDSVAVNIAAGANVICTFNDSQDATLTIVKQATPEGSTYFDFDATGTGVAADIDLVDDGAGPGDNDADFTFDSTQLGTKTVTENVPAGWDLTSATCSRRHRQRRGQRHRRGQHRRRRQRHLHLQRLPGRHADDRQAGDPRGRDLV